MKDYIAKECDYVDIVKNLLYQMVNIKKNKDFDIALINLGLNSIMIQDCLKVNIYRKASTIYYDKCS